MAQVFEKLLKKSIGRRVTIRNHRDYGYSGILVAVDKLCVVIYDEQREELMIFPKNFISLISFGCPEEELSYLLDDVSFLGEEYEGD